ncbi:unnamed protein product, partial [marine sediment metagenome]
MKVIKRRQECVLDPNRPKHTQYSREEIDVLAGACGIDITLPNG